MAPIGDGKFRSPAGVGTVGRASSSPRITPVESIVPRSRAVLKLEFSSVKVVAPTVSFSSTLTAVTPAAPLFPTCSR